MDKGDLVRWVLEGETLEGRVQRKVWIPGYWGDRLVVDLGDSELSVYEDEAELVEAAQPQEA